MIKRLETPITVETIPNTILIAASTGRYWFFVVDDAAAAAVAVELEISKIFYDKVEQGSPTCKVCEEGGHGELNR
jgi:hypothetical protein